MTKRNLILFITAFMTALMITGTSFANGIMAKEGMRGESVKKVQTLLFEQGYLSSKSDIDGICGKKSVAAIKSFQKDHGLHVDGVCGDETYNELKKNHKGHKHDASEKNPHKGEAVYVEATGYSAHDPGNNPNTASGTPVRHGVIAVDPSFIPLGSRVYIPGYGEAVAEDIGWAIQGNCIDVAFDTHEEALAFGRQEIEIYIIEYA